MTFANAAFLFLGIIAGVLALIGLLDAVKGTPVRHVIDFRGAGLPSVRDEAFQTSMELASRTEMCDGNNAEFFWNGDQTYPRLWEDLRSAQHSITFQMYLMSTASPQAASTLSPMIFSARLHVVLAGP